MGAYRDDDKGSAYVYERGVGGISTGRKLTASDGAASDYFGFPYISGDRAIVGDRDDDKGSAYV